MRSERQNELISEQYDTYSDGGSRGNPGPAAAAYLILASNGKIIETGARFLGKRTNNQAEYEGLIAALEAAFVLGAKQLVCYLDSELVCKHLNGQYRVKNVELLKLWNRVQELRRCFIHVRFAYVPRSNEFVVKVDKLVNVTLDKMSV